MTTREYLDALNSVAEQQFPQNGPVVPPTSTQQPPVRLPGLSYPNDRHAVPSLRSTSGADARPSPPRSESQSRLAGPSSTDKEEGELSEAESFKTHSTTSQFAGKQPPTGPRADQHLQRNVHRLDPASFRGYRPSSNPRVVSHSVVAPSPISTPPTSTANVSQQQSSHPPQSYQHASQTTHNKTNLANPLPPSSSPATQTTNYVPHLDAQREHAKCFIQSWHASGNTFQQLIDEGFDKQILQGLYEALAIPVFLPSVDASGSKFPASSPPNNETSSPDQSVTNNANQPQNAPLATASGPQSTVFQTPDISAQSDLSNRENYIARLKAAKTKRPPADNAPPITSTPTSPPPKQTISIPSPPPHNQALNLLNQLCKTVGIDSPQYANARPSKGDLWTLTLKTLPSSLARQLEELDLSNRIDWVKVKPTINLQKDNTLIIKLTISNKKLAKQELARVCFSILATTTEYTGQKPTSYTNGSVGNDVSAVGKNWDQLRESALASLPSRAPKQDAAVELSQKSTTLDKTGGTVGEQATQIAAKREAQTELLRQKLEKLKAARYNATAKSSSLHVAPDVGTNHVTSDGQASLNVQGEANLSGLASPASRIPGLFMTASNTHSHPLSPAESLQKLPNETLVSSPARSVVEPTPTRKLKRPVAADFNDDIEPPATKRPFGQLRVGDEDETMIIEASEDELDSDEEAAATSQDPDTANATKTSSLSSSSKRLANSGPLHPVPSDRRFRLVERTLTPVSRDSTFDRHQQDILAMKRKIAELEQKRKSKLFSSGATTPVPAFSSSNVNVLTPSADGDPKIESTVVQLHNEQKRLSGTPDDSLEGDQNSRSSKANVASMTELSDLQAVSREWRERRRTEIESDLPALDAQQAKDSRELDRLTKQMESLQEEMRRRQESKRLLIEELERLGIGTQGMDLSDLQATKELVTSQNAGQDHLLANADTLKTITVLSTQDTEDVSSPQSQATSSAASMSMSTTDVSKEDQQSVDEIPDGSEPVLGGEDQLSGVDAQSRNKTREHGPVKSVAHMADSLPTDQPYGNPIPSNIDNSSNEQSDIGTPATGSSAQYADDESMGSSDESNYAEGDGANKASVPVLIQKDASIEESGPIISGSAEEAGDYEASSGVDPVRKESIGDVLPTVLEQSNLKFSATPASVNNRKGSISSTFSLDESDVMEESEELETVDSYNSKQLSENQVNNNNNSTLLPAEKDEVSKPESADLGTDTSSRIRQEMDDTEKISSDEALPENERFTPYLSSLRNFKLHRLQPQQSSTAHNELDSAMLLDQIDTEQPLCPFELAGGVCNDDKCEFLHFRTMRLPRT